MRHQPRPGATPARTARIGTSVKNYGRDRRRADLWNLASLLVAVTVPLFILEYKRQRRLYLEERLLKHERHRIDGSDGKGNEGAFWTLQQYDEIGGQPWYALLEQNADGVLRGWTGHRRELESLAKILNVAPQELPPTTSEEFFLLTNISALRSTPARHPLRSGRTIPLRLRPTDDDDSEIHFSD